jgi:hypothetical protein
MMAFEPVRNPQHFFMFQITASVQSDEVVAQQSLIRTHSYLKK